MRKYHHHFPYIAWTIALLATIGSLYFSEILKFTPCVLCWWQRICIYPLVIVLLVGIIRKDKNMAYYALPLSIIGAFISFYQNLLYYKIIPEALAPCVSGVSCTTQYINYFGFISIPLLSLIALIIITTSMIFYVHYENQYDQRS
jgi:disulfide bond formation protein DsbB